MNRDFFKRIGVELLVVAALAGVYFGYQAYQEYRLVKAITYDIACGANYQRAMQLGVPCIPPANAQPQAAPESAPAAPSSTEKPGDDKK